MMKRIANAGVPATLGLSTFVIGVISIEIGATGAEGCAEWQIRALLVGVGLAGLILAITCASAAITVLRGEEL